jgi:adenosine deaminase
VVDYPLTTLVEHGIPVVVNVDMPALFRQTLSDEYIALLQREVMTVDQIEQQALTALDQSYLSEDDKAMLRAVLEAEQAGLRAEHLDANEVDEK